MNADKKLNRRSFLNIGLFAGGGVAGWLTGCDRSQPPPRVKAEKPRLDAHFVYDISAFEHTDPALLLYSEVSQIPTGMQEPKCIAIGPNDTLFIGGDQAVKIFSKDGTPQTVIALPAKPNALAPAEQGRLLVALKDHIEAYDLTGKLLFKGESLGAQAVLTGVALMGENIFVADAGNREIVRCDANGKILGRFGRIGAKDGTPGFLIPSPYFHVLAGSEGVIWVNNPGRHHLEAYTPDGKFETAWGQPGMNVEGFCGCCNPVAFARLPNGRFVTSEKGLNRIKIYDAQGKFIGVVAGPEQLIKDRELARKACADCQVGFGYDVACDSQGRVLALDPVTRAVRIFAPKQK